MSCAGTVLSHPPSKTTASMGWARIISSVSIAIRLRNAWWWEWGTPRAGRWWGRQGEGRPLRHAPFYSFHQRRRSRWQGL